MSYSNIMTKGRAVYQGDWPCVVIGRAKSDKPFSPVLCEVWGNYHECGSVYYRWLTLATNLEEWQAARAQMPEGNRQYFKGVIHTGEEAMRAPEMGLIR